MRILIAEDEERMAAAIGDVLEAQGWQTGLAPSGTEALERALAGGWDAMVLDVMLPGLDGFGVAKRLREARCSLPILMLTARSAPADRVRGLDSGADYYLPKPFSNDELVACLRSVLRRPSRLGDGVLRFGELSLELFSGRLSRGERSVLLSAKELEILRLIVTAGEAGIKKELLFLKAWGYEASCESNVLEQYISFLRKKFKYLDSGVRLVADRGTGYHIET